MRSQTVWAVGEMWLGSGFMKQDDLADLIQRRVWLVFLSGCSEGPAKSRGVIFRRGLRRLRGAYGWASWSISSTSRDRLWQGMLQLMAPLIAELECPSLGYPWI